MAKLLPGSSDDIIKANQRALCAEGMSESQAMHLSLKKARKGRAVERSTKGVLAKRKDQVEIK